MKKIFNILFLFVCLTLNAQTNSNSSFLSFEYFYGYIIVHAPEIQPIAQSNPTGFIVSWNKKKLGESQFENAYNFPDYGFSASYHNFHSDVLGEIYSAYAHYNFYLLNRNSKNQLKLTTAFGLGYSNSPFDKETNSKNWAIGSKFVASVYLKLLYQREYILDRFGVNAGISLIHYSNGSFNVPNLGINTVAATLGVNYNFDEPTTAPEKVKTTTQDKYPIKLNAVFRTGFNESKVNGSGLFPFYTVTFFADKKLSYKSTISLGADLFFPTFMKDYIEWENIQSGNPNETADWKRAGVFVGYELNLEHFSVITNIGYHVYYPYDYVSGIYERFGFRKRFNNHLFADLSLKINMFRAEGLEFGIGYRF